MFKSFEDHSAVLGVCVDRPVPWGRSQGLAYQSATSARRAFDLLAAQRFDLLLVGPRLPDADVWDFVRKVRIKHPHVKWALVGGDVTDQIAGVAQLFGAVACVESALTTDQVLSTCDELRQRAGSEVLHGWFDPALTGAPWVAAG
jgi:DNA-binding NtrC family response regulator